MNQVILKKGKESSLLRRHLWVFSGAVKRIEGSPVEGDLVEVVSHKGEKLGVGHLGGGSIQVRMLALGNETVDQNFWNQTIKEAFYLRSGLGFGQGKETDCYRLINAEGDGLPGLIIDVYTDACVIQTHSAGMQNSVSEIVAALESLEQEWTTIYHRPANKGQAKFLKGNASDAVVSENGMKLQVNWVEGQKTGFFLDQRDNRKLLGELSAGRKVLNTFCYTGGFSVAALNGGAEKVVSVDVSDSAIDLTNKNVELNFPEGSPHQAHATDTFDFLKSAGSDFDIIVLDPPAFAKHLRKRHNAIQGYRRLNKAALDKLQPGSLLMTYSCSQVVDAKMFEKAVMAAALDAKRTIKILKRLGHPADHPVCIYHPEGDYLKGLLLEVR